ncbi:MAG: hypothetical protein H7177_06495 [Rhizobacter sp.]|nr:hypothetical protein [Bacteriovorax sp.]
MELTKKPARSVLAFLLLLLILTLTSCDSTSTSASGTAASSEVSQTGEQDTTSGSSTDSSSGASGGSSQAAGYYTDQVKSIAASSTCASYSFSSRGRAPAAYIKGMALTFARSFCRLKTTAAAPTNLVVLLSGAAGSSSTDALGLYSSKFSGLSMDVINAGENPLRSLYTLGIGLGMRESSGKYCEGRDMSASNTSASTAEAGMFQTSYDSMGANAELSNLYAEYKANPLKCSLDVFSAGVSCSSSTIYGSGEGATYQAMNKSCPAFAAEYAMLMLRVRRNHYGPINRQEAEVVPVCNQMLQSVQDFVEQDLNACDELM